MELLLLLLVGIPNGSERSHRSREEDEEVEMVAMVEGVVTLERRPCSVVTTKSSSKPLSAWDMLPLFGDE